MTQRSSSAPFRADLPMYDWPELASANDTLWIAIAGALHEHGVAAPAKLERFPDLWALWQDPALLLSQTCGAPLVRQLRGKTRYVATPEFVVPGCEGATYSSVIVTRAGARHGSLSDLSNAVAAVNDRDSVSGFWSMASVGLRPSSLKLSGSHRRSARMVVEGEVDFAAIDAMCWDLLARFDRQIWSQLSPLGWTAPAPAPPYLTSQRVGDAGAQRLAEALQMAVRDPEASDACAELRLGGVARLSAAHYATALQPLLADHGLAATPDAN